MTKHHFKKMSKSPYLGSWDLPEMKPIMLTITKAVQEKSHGLKENNWFNIIYFDNKRYKPMIINTTNGKVLSALTGSPYIEDWVGTTIEIRTKKVKAFGELHDALRISTKVVKLVKDKITKDHPRFQEIKDKYKNGADIKVIQRHFDIDENILKD